MPLTSGLLISLAHDERAFGLRQALDEKEGVTAGLPEGRWQPAAIEAEDDARLRELHDWIAALPGVAFVDVVHVNFDDPTTASPTYSP
ncbi:MAG: hypothetical protein JNN17_03765 [Verrucomicrobiaceae bacterium]|nr:hypothetical protein [Verrucomicrobiaceae bacterium]